MNIYFYRVRVMVLNATFNNISVLLVEETGVISSISMIKTTERKAAMWLVNL
jgi:hypothetical protein